MLLSGIQGSYQQFWRSYKSFSERDLLKQLTIYQVSLSPEEALGKIRTQITGFNSLGRSISGIIADLELDFKPQSPANQLYATAPNDALFPEGLEERPYTSLDRMAYNLAANLTDAYTTGIQADGKQVADSEVQVMLYAKPGAGVSAEMARRIQEAVQQAVVSSPGFTCVVSREDFGPAFGQIDFYRKNASLFEMEETKFKAGTVLLMADISKHKDPGKVGVALRAIWRLSPLESQTGDLIPKKIICFVPGALILFTLTIIFSSCVPNAGSPEFFHEFEEEVQKMAVEIRPEETAAVSWVYDQESGDINSLGDRWRQRIETALGKTRVTIKARKEIGFIIDDLETYGIGKEESAIWKAAEAEIIVAGNYRIEQNKGRGKARITITFKALRVADSSLVQAISWSEDLPENWARLAAKSTGNAYHKEIETVVSADGDKPFLKAKLNKEPACYPTGASAELTIETEPGVHLYILNPAADNTVTLLYPNSRMKDQPLPTRNFIFPPPQLARDIQLLLYPLSTSELANESFKIIASRQPLDFSFLPVPENTIYIGAKGGDMKKMLDVLKNARGWSEKSLSYWVGVGCEA